MKGTTSDGSADSHAADAALDREIDAALREIAQPAAVDLRTRVLAVMEEATGAGWRPAATKSRAAVLRPGWPGIWRPAAALAGALAIVLGVFFAWEGTDRRLHLAREGTGKAPASANTPVGSGRAPGLPTAQAAAAGRDDVALAAPVQRVEGGTAARRRHRARPSSAWVDWRAPAESSTEPYLPGAPAGELGDPLAPMPTPPPITIAPIESAPPVTDIARPVTDFPADDQPPDVPARTTGQSGGDRR